MSLRLDLAASSIPLELDFFFLKTLEDPKKYVIGLLLDTLCFSREW